MTFEEAKERYENVFGRKLSDREVAEIALNALSESEQGAVQLKQGVVQLKEEIVHLKDELSASTMLEEPVRLVAMKIQNIVSTKANKYTIRVIFSNTCIPTVDYCVEGEPVTDEDGELPWGEF